ncbi:polysaccharide ABC transporter, ATP-binding protein [Geofilum rubicundum JCM 15548]|uniref:Polysaccharide ABC transporter, ATP-binding protein n=2 Tax=Geofilum TaxID=1236988 RepID=A0A0E9LZB8_9BACT|nr:polysaccharide ABC transporter, ATP-binding protein [Geofilum rubicundum JCM 15548]
MQDVSTNDGRTVLFVSHNMGSVQQLCQKGIILANGLISFQGEIDKTIKNYLDSQEFDSLSSEKKFTLDPAKDFQLAYAKLFNNNNEVKSVFECDEDIRILLEFQNSGSFPGLTGYLEILSKHNNTPILVSDSNDILMHKLGELPSGTPKVEIKIPRRTLGIGTYTVYFNFTNRHSNISVNIDTPAHILSFTLNDNSTTRGNSRKGYISTLLDWKILD